MKVSTFVKNYNEEKLSTLKVKNYVPYLDKISLATKIGQGCYYDENGNVMIKSNAERILIDLMLVDNWTNIDINFESFPDEYDKLNENGILADIIHLIPEKEVSEFKTIIAARKEDIMYNFGRMDTVIINKLKEVIVGAMGILPSFINDVSEKINDLNADLENAEENDNGLELVKK